MKKYALLAAAASLALGGSLARADLVVSSQRTPGTTYDTVTFFVTDTGTGTTAGSSQALTEADAVLFSPQGLLTGPRTSTNTSADIFGANPATAGTASYITIVGSNGAGVADNFGNQSTTGGSVLLTSTSDPSGYTFKTEPGASDGTGGVLVSGIAGTAFFAGDSVADSTPVQFAVAVVPHNGTVELLAPVNHPNPLWEPVGTVFSDAGMGPTYAGNALTAAYVNAVPEPASIGLLGLLAGGLIRRRRQA